MINPNQLVQYVIGPVLKELKMDSEEARALVLETGMQESRLCHLDQLDNANKPGPAFGIFQMERATHNDIWKNWLAYNPIVARAVKGYSIHRGSEHPDASELQGNLYYAAAMTRCHYRRCPGALSSVLEERAAYWKKYYNTYLGAGTVKEYVTNARMLYRVYRSSL